MKKLIGDILDQQLVDRNEMEMGKVDGLVLELRDGEPPRVAFIETGAAVLARRLGPRWERFVVAISRRLGVRRVPRYRIPWNKVRDIGVDVKVDLDARRTPAFAWERRLARLLERIPFAR